jgi:hypothetical protein
MRKPKRYSDGKKIVRWEWTIDGQDVVVDVFLRTRSWGTSFTAYCESPFVEIEDERDLNVLRRATRDRLTALIAVAWESVLVVEVTGERTHWGGGSRNEWSSSGALTFSARSEQRAVISGKPHTRSGPGDRPHEGWTTPEDDGGSSWSDPRTRAMVSDTPENRQALERVSQGLNDLRNGLRALMGSTRLEETLAHLRAGGGLALLSPGEPAEAPAAPVETVPEPVEVGGGLHVSPLGAPRPPGFVQARETINRAARHDGERPVRSRRRR